MVVEIRSGHRLAAEHDVLADGEDRDQHEVLVHHADPQGDGVTRTCDMRTLAVDVDLSRVRRNQAVEDVHQRRLAGAVLADQRVDLARPHAEIHVVVGEYAGKLFGDPSHVDSELLARRFAHSEPGT